MSNLMKKERQAEKHRKFLKMKLEEYLNFSKKHPESHPSHIEHKNKVLIPQIRRAIEKCEEGTFKVCDDCQGEITDARIRSIPMAARCTRCQTILENGGKEPESDPKLLEIFSDFIAETVKSWLEEENPTKESMYDHAFTNWEQAIHDSVLEIEGKEKATELAKMKKQKKIEEFKNTDLSFKSFFGIVQELF